MKHVVIIDDDPDILSSVTMLLTISGYRVSSFGKLNNYDELAALNADCFLIDENLPIVSGHIICIMLKSKYPTKNIPVILLSASNKLEYVATLGEADASLAKPFDIAELLSIIGSLCK